MSISALQAAKVACETSGWSLTNLQLQKMLYIAHMLYAGRNDGKPLIEDELFEAWDYGPVLPSVYRHVSAFGDKPIRNVFRRIDSIPPWSDEHKIIEDAVKRLSQFNPFRLVEITHEHESAWYKNYFPGATHIEIPHQDVIQEYRDRFSHEREAGEAQHA